MALLKANGSFLKANGKVLVKSAVSSPFLFYTDFRNVDMSLQVDTPLIGESGVYKRGDFYIYEVFSSGGPFNLNYVNIYNFYDFPQMVSPYKMTDQVEQLTLEFWMKRGTSAGLYLQIPSGGSIFILNNLIHLQVGSGYTCTIYNGTSYHTNSDATKIIKTPDNTSNWVHVAVVNNKGSFDLYTNGFLRAKFVRTSPINILSKNIVLFGTGSTGFTNIAYISVRRGNQSNNNESFTVPIQPYM